MNEQTGGNESGEILAKREGYFIHAFVLLITILVCGWRVWQMGFYADDYRNLWWFANSSHPVMFLDGRFSGYVYWWAFWRLFEFHPGLYHVFHVALHVLVANEILLLLGQLRVSPYASAVGVLGFAVMPYHYETLYLLNCACYPLAALLFLFCLRVFLHHLGTNKVPWLVMAWAIYFFSCGIIELMWCLCPAFCFVQAAHQSLNEKDAFSGGKLLYRYRKGLTFVLVAILAVGVYICCNHLATRYTDRIASVGGFIGVEQIPHKVVSVWRTTMTSPVRHTVSLFRESLQDLGSGMPHSSGGFLSMLLILIAAFSLAGIRSVVSNRSGNGASIAWLPTAFLGLLIVLLSNLPVALLRNQGFSPRMFYISWIGISILTTLVIEIVVCRVQNRRWRLMTGAIVSLGVAFYLVGAAIIHLCVKDVFVRSWDYQKSLRHFAMTTLSGVDKTSQFYFVSNQNPVQTHLSMRFVDYQFWWMDYLLSYAWGIRRPDLVDAGCVNLGVVRKTDGTGIILRYTGTRQGEIDLDAPSSLGKKIVFGFDGRKMAIFTNIHVSGSGGSEGIDYPLPKPANSIAPNSSLDLHF